MQGHQPRRCDRVLRGEQDRQTWAQPPRPVRGEGLRQGDHRPPGLQLVRFKVEIFPLLTFDQVTSAPSSAGGQWWPPSRLVSLWKWYRRHQTSQRDGIPMPEEEDLAGVFTYSGVARVSVLMNRMFLFRMRRISIGSRLGWPGGVRPSIMGMCPDLY